MTMPDHIQVRKLRYSYNVLDMRRLDSEDFLRSENPDALVLAILCNMGERDPDAVVTYIVKELRRLHGSKIDSFNDSLLKLETLARNRNLQNLVKEKSEMIVNIEELATYQAGVERGHLQGREEERQEMVFRLLDKFLPEQVAEFSGVPLEKIKAMQEDAKS